MTITAAFLLGCALARADARLLEMKVVKSKGQFADIAAMLEDSLLCDTSLCIDGQGRAYRVFVDSGKVYFQTSLPLSSSPRGEEEKRWTVPIRLSFTGVNSSPVVFFMDEPGERPRLVAMWREEHEDWVEVWFRSQWPGALPMQWSTPYSLAQPRN